MKRLLHWAGGALAIIGGVFVVLRLRQHAAGIDFERLTGAHLAVLVLLAMVYGGANTFLALAWRNLLAFCRETTTRRWAIYAYGSSQLAKYIPGNIFQFAGRLAIGMADGYGGWALARSTLWELGLISVAGAIYGCLALNLVFEDIPTFASLLAFAFALAAAIALSARFLSRHVAIALAEQALFLALSGAVFVGCLVIAAPEIDAAPGRLMAVAGAFVLAWLVGLVTPGAPAGLGVREAVLLVLLAGIGTEPEVLLAVLLGRIVNVVGDALFFGVGIMLGRMRK
jgi:uncharacterized membrane protein YbhN (UPF0104 family)